MRDHPHPEPDGPRGHHRADVAAADEAEGLAGDLGAHEAGLLPLPGGGRGVRLRDLAGERHHHGDRVLGGGDRVAEGRVHHDDPARRGGGDVDVVHADPGAADHPERVGLRDDLGRGLGGRADGEPVIPGDPRGEGVRILSEIGLEIGLDPAVAEDLHGGVGKLVGNQDLGHRKCSFRRTRVPAPRGPSGRGATRGAGRARWKWDQAAAFSARAAAKAQSSQGVSASMSAVSTVAPHQTLSPGGASR